MRIWFKEWANTRLLKDFTYEDLTDDTRTHKIFRGLDVACRQLDLARPNWLDVTVRDFKRHSKARFTKDCFPDEIGFDYLEIEVLEED